MEALIARAEAALSPRVRILILARIRTAPTRRDLVRRPSRGDLRDHLDHDVQMVAHNRVAPDRYCKHLSQMAMLSSTHCRRCSHERPLP